jgi:predicted Rossmann fold flavoprotein
LHADVAVVGAGAAGLATAIFLRRGQPDLNVVLIDGARRPGAKILVSGGSRCNVTNVRVTERDFWGGSRSSIRQVLRTFPVEQTIAFFKELGVALHEEERGKLFPNSNRSRDVLEALLKEADRAGVVRLDSHRVLDLSREPETFVLATSQRQIRAHRLVLATGGQSLPRSGSDGAGLEFARSLGHRVVPPVPALVPLLLDPAALLAHADLSGVSHEAEVAVWLEGRIAERIQGPLLWTHFGISGPAALDVSRFWTRATCDNRRVELALNFLPGRSFDDADACLAAFAAERSRASLHTVVADLVPAAVAAALLRALRIDSAQPAGTMTRQTRRRLAHALVEWRLPVIGTRGYNYAEVTAGGVDLTEIDPKTMQSRVCPGLFLVGEMIDVDGRLGGFNFQWAWASAKTAARALAN